MHPLRFPYPTYMQQQTQWRPHGPQFFSNGPMACRNRPQHSYSKVSNQFYNNNDEHWCETCDRGFKNLQLLEQHKQQHQKCNIDGCQFIAHPKVITKHIQMQHSTGLFKKIVISNNPEEIKKWREERKRRYPTKENIEKKGAEIKEKIDRGEKMGMKYNRDRTNQKGQGTKRKFNDNSQKQSFKRTFQGNKNFTEQNKPKTILEAKKKSTLPSRHNNNKFICPVENLRTIKPFTGILHLLDDTDNDDITEEVQDSYLIEDDDYSIETKSVPLNDSSTTNPIVCEALSSLICNYESSDDESNTTNVSTMLGNSKKDNNVADHNNETSKSNVCKSDSDSGPEETKIVKVNLECNTTLSADCNKERKQTKIDNRIKKTDNRNKHENIHKRNNLKLTSKLPSTLLEKLLHNEIRQERNIILQCIRYIVKNNYFQKTE